MAEDAVPLFDVTQNRGWKVDLQFGIWVVGGALCGAVRGANDVMQSAGSVADNMANLHDGVVGLAITAVTLPLGLLQTALDQKGEAGHRKTIADLPSGDHLPWDPSNFRLEAREVKLALFSEAPALLSPKTPTQKLQLQLQSGETRHFTLAKGEDGGQLQSLMEENGIPIGRA